VINFEFSLKNDGLQDPRPVTTQKLNDFKSDFDPTDNAIINLLKVCNSDFQRFQVASPHYLLKGISFFYPLEGIDVRTDS
ncbi:hypothetical protein, partial [Klebsiella pneumoniae]|uniref:hypothetical protein n=1 Tax=Klebsiella pneumoniae TaxID=573 RepID=UPI001D0E3868